MVKILKKCCKVVVLFNVFTLLSGIEYYDEELLIEENFGSKSLGIFHETDECENTFEVIYYSDVEVYAPAEDSNGYMMIARSSGCMGIPSLSLHYGYSVEILLKCSKFGNLTIESNDIQYSEKRVIFNTTVEVEHCWKKYAYVLEGYVDKYLNIRWTTDTLNKTNGEYFVMIDYIKIIGPKDEGVTIFSTVSDLEHDIGLLEMTASAALVLLPAACILGTIIVFWIIVKH